jgi:hypothetical protein
VFGVEFDHAAFVEVEGADAADDGGDLLAVGADVLNGSAADGAGDSGEAFDAGAVLLDGALDELIPVFASGDAEQDTGLAGVLGTNVLLFDAPEGDVEDEAGKAGVGDEEVAAAAEDE